MKMSVNENKWKLYFPLLDAYRNLAESNLATILK